jgi:hypothetical protein
MPQTMTQTTVPDHHKRLEAVESKMAKADLKNVEVWKREVGQAIDYAIALSNRTQKEVWVALGHSDGAQLSRWIAATENAQLGPLFAIGWLRQSLVIALVGIGGAEVTTQITLRQRA